MALTLAEMLADLEGDLDARLSDLVREAAELRDQSWAQNFEDDIETLHRSLVSHRARLDRLEEITGLLIRMKGRTAQAVEDCQNAFDGKYAEAAGTSRDVGFSDYASAKEKDAQFLLKAMKEKLALAKAKKMDRNLWTALDFVRLLHRGLGDAKHDLETRVRIIDLQGRLDS